jgi:hypothetical protein
MSATNTTGAAVLDELLRELNGGIISLDLLKRTAAALEEHVERDKRRMSGRNWRKALPEHQRDVERQAVADKWAYVNGAGLHPGSPGRLNYSGRVAWVAKRTALPVGRVRKYLREISQSKTCDLLGKHDNLVVWAKCEACQVAGDACLEHASAQRIFNAARPDVPKKPRPSEKRVRLKKPHALEMRMSVCEPKGAQRDKEPRRFRGGVNGFTDLDSTTRRDRND